MRCVPDAYAVLKNTEAAACRCSLTVIRANVCFFLAPPFKCNNTKAIHVKVDIISTGLLCDCL